jgi:hypothetical protein
MKAVKAADKGKHVQVRTPQGDGCFACALEERNAPGAAPRPFPFRHGGGQVEQPADPGGKTFPVHCNIAFRAVIDDRQKKGQQAAVPSPQLRGIEGHPGCLWRGFDHVLHLGRKGGGIGQPPSAGKGYTERTVRYLIYVKLALCHGYLSCQSLEVAVT